MCVCSVGKIFPASFDQMCTQKYFLNINYLYFTTEVCRKRSAKSVHSNALIYNDHKRWDLSGSRKHYIDGNINIQQWPFQRGWPRSTLSLSLQTCRHISIMNLVRK